MIDPSPRHAPREADLHALVDDELAPGERAEIEAQLAAFPAELALARELGSLNDAIKTRYADKLTAPVPAAIEARLSRFPRGRRNPSLRRMAWPAGTLVLVLGAAAAGYLASERLTSPPGRAASFVVTALGAHSVYVHEVRHPVEVKAGEAHLVRWLAKRVGAPIRAPVLGRLGWKLMGGRLLADQDGHPAAQFMYQGADKRRLTLYIRKETGRGNTAFRYFERDGFSAFYWIDRPLAYALTGRLPRDDLTKLAHAVYRQLQEREGSGQQGAGPRDAGPSKQ